MIFFHAAIIAAGVPIGVASALFIRQSRVARWAAGVLLPAIIYEATFLVALVGTARGFNPEAAATFKFRLVSVR